MSKFPMKSISGAVVLLLAFAFAPTQYQAQGLVGTVDADSIGDTRPRILAKFYSVRLDLRRCISPLCGGYFIKAVNELETRCADGSWADECYVAKINFFRLRGRDLSEFHNSGNNLVYGRLSAREHRYFGTLGVLVANNAWYGAGKGVFTHPGPEWSRVGDKGIQCITFPCYSINQIFLNTRRMSTLSGLDLSAVAADQRERDMAEKSFANGRLLVAGENVQFPNQGPAGDGLTLIANQFYLPLRYARIQ